MRRDGAGAHAVTVEGVGLRRHGARRRSRAAAATAADPRSSEVRIVDDAGENAHAAAAVDLHVPRRPLGVPVRAAATPAARLFQASLAPGEYWLQMPAEKLWVF